MWEKRGPLLSKAVWLTFLAWCLAVLGCAVGVPESQPIAKLQEAVCAPVVERYAPSHDRQWAVEQAVLPQAEFDGCDATVRNIRRCDFRSAEDFSISYYDKTFSLDDVRSVDVIIVPFSQWPDIAHVMMSFGFEGEEYLGVSVEGRREVKESYNPLSGAARQYELIYVVADERDLIPLRTNVWLDEVYLYRLNLSPEEARSMFVDVMRRVNRLEETPEFYHTITNNCSLNLFEHLKKVRPEQVRLNDMRILLAGQADRMLFEAGLLATEETFEQTRMAARVNYAAYRWRDDPQFSALIRMRR